MTPAATNQRADADTCRRGHRGALSPRRGGYSTTRCRICDAERKRLKRSATKPAAVRGDDGIERYPIDEWKRRFGQPPLLVTSYDAYAE